MIRLFYTFLLLIAVLSPPACAEVRDENAQRDACIRCHEETYVKATRSRYPHSVIHKGCTICHKVVDDGDDALRRMSSSTYQNEGVFYLGVLDREKKYKVEVTGTDMRGKKSEPALFDISFDRMWKRDAETFSLRKLSAVKVESVERKMFASATITWKTDVPATSDIEYGLSGKRKRILRSKDMFSRDHKVRLNGLKHKKTYDFMIVSKDLNGNIVRSGSHTIDTSKNFNTARHSLTAKDVETAITDAVPFRVVREDDAEEEEPGGNRDFFIRVTANRPVKFSLNLMEEEEKPSRPCAGFEQNRYSTIEACITCHPQDASHPVGVKSSNPKIVVSNELPTIEDGIITCVSCHYAHGGDKAYFVRVTFSKEICVKCHSKYYR